jgi:hypothetical protein
MRGDELIDARTMFLHAFHQQCGEGIQWHLDSLDHLAWRTSTDIGLEKYVESTFTGIRTRIEVTIPIVAVVDWHHGAVVGWRHGAVVGHA